MARIMMMPRSHGKRIPAQKGRARQSLMVLAALVVLCTVLPAESGWGAEPPNIVFVLFDDFGYGQPPSYRKESVFKTPNMDRLAHEGMRFTDAHSAASNCTPTRYGVLTGRYPCRIAQF
ncbi:MAG: sulfatase-like hydrolase/transferase, partial [Pirellulaceae bacterium]